MDIKWLEDFVTLSRLQSFSRAAEERHVTQSAFSRRIQALETWVGVPLLDRSRFPTTLTPEGRRFRETAEEILRNLLQSRAALTVSSPADLPCIAVAALHTLSVTFFPQWLSRMETAAGMCGSRLLPDDFHNCMDAIVDGSHDFFLTFYHEAVPLLLHPSQFPHCVLGQDSLVPVGHSLHQAHSGFSYPLLMYSSNSFLGQVCQCPQAQAVLPYGADTVRHVNENAMAEGLRQMVLAGHGCAWLPRSLIAKDLETNRMVVMGQEIPLEIRLYRKAEHTRPVVEQVWQVSQKMALCK
ncbi:MAG: LysR family transcriptional regulator [Acetobacter fabarum]|uniref:LysR family transcriptional regulator n=1 Tax=Acetobacter fabarum TaxID=483199 RepID=UPI0039E87915